MRKLAVVMIALVLIFAVFGNAGADLNDGLVAYYPLDGNANDSTNSNDGNEQGGVVYVQGVKGQGASFDGINDRILVPDNPLLHFGNGPFTISFWMKTTSAESIYIIDKDVSGTPSGLYRFRLSTGKCTFQIQDAGHCCSADETYSSSVVNDDQWHHVVGVRNSDSLLIYVDGEFSGIDNDLIIGNTDNNSPLSFGGASLANNIWYDGALDEIKIYYRALSECEIQELYTGTPDPDCGLVAYYPFNGDANDESGNGNDGIEIGGVTYVDGFKDQSASFDGDYDYITFPNGNPIFGSNTFTTSLYFKIDEVAPSDGYAIFYLGNNKLGTTSNEEEFHIVIGEYSSTLHVTLRDVYIQNSRTSYNSEITINDWHHIVSVVTDSIITIYLDGEKKATIPVDSPFDLTSSDWDVMRIGIQKWDSTQRMFLNGSVDEVRLYNRALSEDEVLKLSTANNPPVLDPIGNKTGNEGSLLEFTISATDPDEGDILTFDATGLPEGATLDTGTGVFSWMPNYSQFGTFEVIFSVFDNGNPIEVDSEIVTINIGDVNRPPIFVEIEPISIFEGESIAVYMEANDPDGDNVSITGETLPEGATLDQDNGLFYWTPGQTDEGCYFIYFNAMDNGVPAQYSTYGLSITVGDIPTPIEQAYKIISLINSYSDQFPSNFNKYLANVKNIPMFLEKGKTEPATNNLLVFIQKTIPVINDTIEFYQGFPLIRDAAYLAGEIQNTEHDWKTILFDAGDAGESVYSYLELFIGTSSSPVYFVSLVGTIEHAIDTGEIAIKVDLSLMAPILEPVFNLLMQQTDGLYGTNMYDQYLTQRPSY